MTEQLKASWTFSDDPLGKTLERIRMIIHPLTQQGEDRIWRAAEKACALLDEAEALALTRPSPEADAWKPIETAPKDGSSILAIWRWGDDPINGAETHMVVRWCGWWDAHGFTQPEPTHWRPLPEPPALARTPAQEGE